MVLHLAVIYRELKEPTPSITSNRSSGRPIQSRQHQRVQASLKLKFLRNLGQSVAVFGKLPEDFSLFVVKSPVALRAEHPANMSNSANL